MSKFSAVNRDFSKFSDNVRDLAVVVAFDPGETTGFAVLGVEPDVLCGYDLGAHMPVGALNEVLSHIEYGEIDCGARHGETGEGALRGHGAVNLYGESLGIGQMVLLLRYYHLPAIVMEDFIVDFNQITSDRSALSPVRITAAFTHAIKDHLDRLFLQNRSLAKTTCTDERLKNWGLYDAHSGPHARDAIRHAYYFLRTCHGNSTAAQNKRWLAWPHLFENPFVSEKSQKPARGGGGEIIPRLG